MTSQPSKPSWSRVSEEARDVVLQGVAMWRGLLSEGLLTLPQEPLAFSQTLLLHSLVPDVLHHYIVAFNGGAA